LGFRWSSCGGGGFSRRATSMTLFQTALRLSTPSSYEYFSCEASRLNVDENSYGMSNTQMAVRLSEFEGGVAASDEMTSCRLHTQMAARLNES